MDKNEALIARVQQPQLLTQHQKQQQHQQQQKPITKSDLPPEAQALIGQACDCSGCSQPLCPPNPNLTCQVVSLTQGVRSSYLANALKGDLVLCPGDGTSPFAGLLGALEPKQVYTHMGIMVADLNRVRHATMIDSRMRSYPRGKLFGQIDFPAPIDGFESDKVQFGWPGTITQSVDEAYNASRDSSFPAAQYSDRPGADSAHKWAVDALSLMQCTMLRARVVHP